METATTTTPALKDWGAVAHALLAGRQTILLRKGGIHERAFTVPSAGRGGFVLFPTVAHSHAERVRPEHADLLALGAADVTAESVTLRCGIVLHEVVPVEHPERLPEIADLHIWTDRSVQEDRVDFRPRHALQVLVVQASALPEPVTLPRLEAYGGCRSWLELPVVWEPRAGTAVHAPAHLAADAERVRASVGA
jgi:hypothetical protein